MKNSIYHIFILTFLCFNLCEAQKVERKGYNMMLKSLLKHDVNECTVHQADSLRKIKNVVFLDTREHKEYEVSHLPNAIWVGYDDFDVARLKGVRKDAEIIAYCSVGARSEKVVRELSTLGYQNLTNMYGSIFEWVNQGYTVVDMNNNPTNRVHTYNKVWGIWLRKGEKVHD